MAYKIVNRQYQKQQQRQKISKNIYIQVERKDEKMEADNALRIPFIEIMITTELITKSLLPNT